MALKNQISKNGFLIALAVCVALSACSKPIQVEGEVFLASSSQSTPTPLRGVQVYFFTEKQHQSLLEHLNDWRRDLRWSAQGKDYDTLDAEHNDLFKKHQSSDGMIYRENVPQEVWDRIHELKAILEKGSYSYWENRYPANFEPYSAVGDFNELTEDVTSVVSDSSGKFQVSLRTEKKYWVWCSGSSTRERGANTTRPWLFQFVTNGSKLVLSEVNRLPETAE